MKLFIDTEWYEMIQDLPEDKQTEVMRAIMSYPDGNSDTNIWRRVILPKLQKSERAYKEKSLRFAENRKKRWNKASVQMSEQISEQICDKKSEQTSVQKSNRCQYVNVDVNEINNSRKDIKNLSTVCAGGKGISLPDAVLPEFENLRDPILQWLEYKAARKERYKTPQSVRMFAKRLDAMANGDSAVATQIIEQSIANNWAGIFPLKESRADPPGDRRNIDDPDNFVI